MKAESRIQESGARSKERIKAVSALLFWILDSGF
jgi:hypothetical protein